MKRCPQCQNLYSEENLFCFYDGKPLVEDLPVEEFAFSAHHPPVVVDLSAEVDDDTPTVVLPTQSKPTVNKEDENKKGSKKLLLTLLAVLLIGGGLVLGLAVLIISQPGEPVAANNSNSANKGAVASEKHKERNKTRKDSEFNGFVLTDNANLRSAPGSSAIVDILPQNDRLNIVERNSNSPWYRVICEHGVSGWMHGNTIDWSPDAFPF